MDNAGDLRGEDRVGLCRVLHNAAAARRCDDLLGTHPDTWQSNPQPILGD